MPSNRRRASIVIAGLAASLLTAFSPTAEARSSLLWNGDFDSGSIPRWSSSSACGGGGTSGVSQYRSVEGLGNKAGKCPTVRLVKYHTRTGKGRALKVDMPPGAKRATPSSAYRWFVSANANGTREQYFAVSVWFGKNVTKSSTWMSPISWRTDGSAGDSLVVHKKGNRLVFRRSVNGSWPDGAGKDDIDMGRITTGRWIDFVFRIRWSARGGTGIRQVYRDGKLMGTSRKMNTRNGHIYRFRVGMYQDSATKVRRTVYYDAVKIGRTYASVRVRAAR